MKDLIQKRIKECANSLGDLSELGMLEGNSLSLLNEMLCLRSLKDVVLNGDLKSLAMDHVEKHFGGDVMLIKPKSIKNDTYKDKTFQTVDYIVAIPSVFPDPEEYLSKFADHIAPFFRDLMECDKEGLFAYPGFLYKVSLGYGEGSLFHKYITLNHTNLKDELKGISFHSCVHSEYEVVFTPVFLDEGKEDALSALKEVIRQYADMI